MTALDAGPFLSFQPFDWQRRWLELRCKSPWAIGGNRAGKSYVGGYRVASRLHGYCPVTGQTWDAQKGWAIGLSYGETENVLKPKIFNFLGRLGIDFKWTESKQRVTMPNGSQLWFKSCDQGAGKFQGEDLDFAWFDEEPPYDVFKETWTRTIDRRGMVFGTLTPLKGSAWLYRKVYAGNNPDFQVVSMAMTDNKTLSQDEIRSAAAMYGDQDEIDVRIRGIFKLRIGRPVLPTAALQRIHKLHVTAPVWQGDLEMATVE